MDVRDEKHRAADWLRVLWLPLVITMAFRVVNVSLNSIDRRLPAPWPDRFVFAELGVLALLALVSGSLVVRRRLTRPWGGAVAGVVLTIAHFLLGSLFAEWLAMLRGVMAAGFSYTQIWYPIVAVGITAPVAAALGWLGGWLATRTPRAAA